MNTPYTHLLAPHTRPDLSTYPTHPKMLGKLDKKKTEEAFLALREEFISWQPRLYAEGQRKLLIILQALDAGGKDGTIRNILQGVNPQGVTVSSFKAPTSHELAHDFLWRVHQVVPASGYIGVFNRSHYEDVLVVRVQNLAPEAVWRARYEQINQFEKLLHDTGTTILKFYLHISKEEQRERLQERLDDPEKRWKFDPNDLKQREKWDEYREAFEETFLHCSTQYAPWHLIPADAGWYRNWAIMQVIVENLRKMNPQYPSARTEIMNYKVV